jgi:hypothetical protein
MYYTGLALSRLGGFGFPGLAASYMAVILVID